MSGHIDDESNRRPKRARTSSNADDVRALQCQVCHRTYDRIDHLNRHLDSHRNERSFRCGECPAAFNRRDLLLRHQANHSKNASEGLLGINRPVERATRACNSCVISKVRCDNHRPCQRCLRKNIECTIRTAQVPDASVTASSPRAENGSEQLASLGQSPPELLYPVDAFMTAVASHQGLSVGLQEGVDQPHGLADFFEQIMVTQSDYLASEYLHAPPDLTTWLPETNWFGETDLFGADFVPAVDETFNTPPVDGSRVSVAATTAGTTLNNARAANTGDAVRRRHAVFRQSPWFWIPQRNQNAFSEQEGFTLDEQHVDLALSPHRPHASLINIPGRLSQHSRDHILQLVLKTAPSQISMSSFPSVDCLDKLVKVGVAKRLEGDAWIHPYTLGLDSARPEFLTALVVAGCICFGIPSVNKTGLILHDIVRESLRELAERDNSVVRDLQYLQASMLCLDIGAFCGFQRKMQVAESSFQVLVTSLRRAGRFDDVRYPTITLKTDDDGDRLDEKWRQWIELEAYKRLVYHLFEHDIYMTMIHHRQPLLSYAELTLPLPASESLWLAPSAASWARLMSEPAPSFRPSMRSVLQDPGLISCLHVGFDGRVARSAYIHGTASQIWEHRQQAVLLHEMSDASSQLWSRSRQQILQESLRKVEIVLDSSSALVCVFQQFLQMYLHVDLDTITRFAGRCGEEAAHRAYITLQSWCKSREARTAIAYAGQVIHAARQIRPYHNRGQDSFIIYHSIMVIWTYSMITSDQERKTGFNTPDQPSIRATSDLPVVHVFLDDAWSSNQSAIDSFIVMNNGTPCLRMLERGESNAEETEVCILKYPWQVMQAGVALLDGTHPDVDRSTGPPLLRALCGLMEELGGLRSG